MGGRDRCGSRARWVVASVMVGAVGIMACGGGQGDDRAAVTEVEATRALDGMVALAAEQTPEAMAELCDLSLDHCAGISGGVLTAPGAEQVAPGDGSSPTVLCSRDAGDGAWMLVVEGSNGLGRRYVSEVVFGRDGDGRAVPVREPAFWLGVAYAGTKVTGSTSWSTAYSAGGGTAEESGFTDRMLQRARNACTGG